MFSMVSPLVGYFSIAEAIELITLSSIDNILPNELTSFCISVILSISLSIFSSMFLYNLTLNLL